VPRGKSCPWIISEVKCMFFEPSPTELEIFSLLVTVLSPLISTKKIHFLLSRSHILVLLWKIVVSQVFIHSNLVIDLHFLLTSPSKVIMFLS
jgi:hypothetical protein